MQYLFIDTTSLPMGSPQPREVHKPTIFATRVRAVRYSLSTTPRRMVFISGIPDPRGRMESKGLELE